MEPPQALLLTPIQEPGVNTTVHLTPHTPLAAQPAGSVAYIPAQCSPLIPILLPHQQGSGPYAVYLQPSSLRPNPLARPQPTSLAVRSMTFEDKTGQSPTGHTAPKSQLASRASDVSPLALKRQCSDSASEGSPSKAQKTDPNLKVRKICSTFTKYNMFRKTWSVYGLGVDNQTNIKISIKTILSTHRSNLASSLFLTCCYFPPSAPSFCRPSVGHISKAVWDPAGPSEGPSWRSPL